MTAAEFVQAKKIGVAISSNAIFMTLGAVVGHWVVWVVVFLIGFVTAILMELAANRAAKEAKR